MIEVKQVSKEFANQTILNQIDFSVDAGEIVGILGKNGVGKSTLIRMILGELQPNSGEILLFDEKKVTSKLKEKIGVLLQESICLPSLTVKESLMLFQTYYTNYYAVEELLELVHLSQHAKKMCHELSGGQLRRLNFAYAIVGKPQLLILDEPTVGMDFQLREELWAYIRKLSAAGTTVVLTTHHVEEIEALCERVIFLKEGAIAHDGSLKSLKNKYEKAWISIDKYKGKLPELKNVTEVTIQKDKLLLESSNLDALIYELVEKKVKFKHLETQHTTFLDVYRDLMEDKADE